MAITHVGTPTTATANNPTTLTLSSHVVDAGSNRILIVGVGWRAFGSEVVSSVVWDAAGVNEVLTSLRTDTAPSSGYRTEFFYLVGPTVKTADVTITLSGASGRVIGGASNYQGVDQSTPVEAEGGNGSDSASSLTSTVTTLTDNAWLVAITGQRAANEAMAITSPGTERWEQGSGAPSASAANFGDEAIASFGSADIASTWTTSGACAQSVGALKAFVAGGGLSIPVAMDYYRRLRVGA